MTIKRVAGFAILASLAIGLAYMAQVAPVEALTLFTAMPVVQSAYSERMTAGLPGQIASMASYDADTVNIETSGGIQPGVAVGQGSAADGVVVGGTLALFKGVLARDVTVINSTAADTIPQNQNGSAVYRGDIWVKLSADVLITDPVHYSATTGIFAPSGGSGPITGARWMTSGLNGGVAKLRLGTVQPVP